MVKIILLIATIAVSSISSQAQVKFGAQAGANLGLSHAKNDFYSSTSSTGGAVGNDPKIGILIGLLAEVGPGKIAFRPELNFIQRGSKSGEISFEKSKISLSYLEVPLNVVYNLEIGKSGKFFFGLGPNIAFGLGGKTKTDDGMGGSYSIKLKFDGKKAPTNDRKIHLKKTDLGANILAGFKIKMGLFAKVGYTYGFTNIYPDKSFEGVNTQGSLVYYHHSYKNRNINISVGYMFGKK